MYHFGATLLATGMVLWVLYYAMVIYDTSSNNYKQTQCNQGLLTLALYDEWIESRLSSCSDAIQNTLREKY